MFTRDFVYPLCFLETWRKFFVGGSNQQWWLLEDDISLGKMMMTGCWFGTLFLFSPIVGMMIQSD